MPRRTYTTGCRNCGHLAFQHQGGTGRCWARTGLGCTCEGYVAQPAKVARGQRAARGSGVRIVYNRLLGGWYIVRGPAQTPLGGRFDSKALAEQHLQMRKNNDTFARIDQHNRDLHKPRGQRVTSRGTHRAAERARNERGGYPKGYVSPRVERSARAAIAAGATTRRAVLAAVRRDLGRDYQGPDDVVNRSVDYWLAHPANAMRTPSSGGITVRPIW